MIKVTADELHSLSGQLQAIATDLEQQNTAALAKVKSVVGESWEGDASTQFGALFDQWRTGAHQVQTALHGISTGLMKAGTAYSENEASIKKAFTA
jgi:WXG100 family type VII secretion target